MRNHGIPNSIGVYFGVYPGIEKVIPNAADRYASEERKTGSARPIRLKGARNGCNRSLPTKNAAEESSEQAATYKSKSGKQPKSYKLYDGDNLYIEIFRNGSKIWRFRFKFPKENVICLGKYPKVSLAKAREERDKWLDLLARGIDPSLHRRLAKDAKTGQAEDAFEVIAKEWLAKFIDTKSASHSKRVHARFENGRVS